MAFQDYSQPICGNSPGQKLYSVTVGASDLPGNTADFFQVGDQVVNFNPTLGSPVLWVVTSINPLTFTPASYTGAGGPFRTSAVATTVATTDIGGFVFLSAAAAVALPAASVFPVSAPFTVKSASAGSVTITPASGNIDAAAALTLAGEAKATIISDGTNYWTVG